MPEIINVPSGKAGRKGQEAEGKGRVREKVTELWVATAPRAVFSAPLWGPQTQLMET